MTYRNYRNALHRQMMDYLRFMKCVDTDAELLALNAEVNLLRIKVEFLDRKTASEMEETVRFDVHTFESLAFATAAHIIDEILDFKEDLDSKYVGITYIGNLDRYKASLKHRGKTFLDDHFETEEAAVRERDRIILKYHLPHPLHELKKNFKP